MNKSKQILIDYQEYLELERYREIINDLEDECKWSLETLEDPITNTRTAKIDMPKSFKSHLSVMIDTYRLDKLILKNKEEK